MTTTSDEHDKQSKPFSHKVISFLAENALLISSIVTAAVEAIGVSQEFVPIPIGKRISVGLFTIGASIALLCCSAIVHMIQRSQVKKQYGAIISLSVIITLVICMAICYFAIHRIELYWKQCDDFDLANFIQNHILSMTIGILFALMLSTLYWLMHSLSLIITLFSTSRLSRSNLSI